MCSFDVLISVYFKDEPSKFRRSLDSIINNSLQPQTIVLVLDGNLTVELYRIVDYFERKFKHIVVVRNPKNLGLACALNLGLQYCRSDFVLRCDADDFNIADRFFVTIEYLKQNPSVDVLGGQILETPSGLIRSCPLDHDSIVRFSKFRSPLNHMTVAMRRSAVISVGGYPNLYLKEDYALWLMLISAGYNFSNLGRVLVYASFDEASIRRRSGFRYLLSEYDLFCFRKKIGDKYLTRLFSFISRSFFVLFAPLVGRLLYRLLFRT